MGFIFGGTTGKTPEDLAKERALAEALLARGQGGVASNVGEGLAQLGQALAGRLALSRVNAAEKQNNDLASQLYKAAIGGGTGFSSPLPATAGAAAGPLSVASAPAGDGSTAKIEAYIRKAAGARGIDPEIAVRVAKSEGLQPGTWQSNFRKNGVRETSYGPFQLLKGGGLGDKAGFDVADPSTVYQGIDFALDNAAKGGWGPWYGAKRIGLDNWAGINRGADPAIASMPAVAPAMPQPEAAIMPAAAPAMPQAPMPEAAMAGPLTPEQLLIRNMIDRGKIQAPYPTEGAAMPQSTSVAPVSAAAGMEASPQIEGPGMPAQGPAQVTAAASNPLGVDPAVMQALANPYLNEGQKYVLTEIFKRQAAASQPRNPMDDIELRKAQIELDQIQNPQQKPMTAAEIESNRLAREKFEFEKAQGGKPTDDMRELNAINEQRKSAGLPPFRLDEWLTMSKKAGATTVTVGGEPGDGALRKKLDEKTGELWSEYQSRANVSSGTVQDLDLVDELIKVAPQGPITGRLAQKFPGFTSAGAAFESVVKRIAPTLRTPGSGSTSDIEYAGMLASVPALTNDPLGNQLISRAMRNKAEINMERGAVVSAYQNGEITRTEANNRFKELDGRSILTPEMKELLDRLNAVETDVKNLSDEELLKRLQK